MFRHINFGSVLTVFVASTMLVAVPQVCASDPTCDEDGGPYVCVAWSQGAAPEEGYDFEFDFSDPDKPDVTIRTEDLGWEVWSQVSEQDSSPAALGDLLLNPENNDDNFGVTVTGATTVESIVLNYTAQEWTGYSNISVTTTGTLAGDLVVVKDNGGNGGDGVLAIGGDVEGDISIPGEAYGDIEGDFAGDLMDIGVIPFSKFLEIHGDLSGDLEVDTIEAVAFLYVWGAVPEGVTVEITNMAGIVYFGGSGGQYPFKGDVILTNGMSSGTVEFGCDLASGASVDFTGDDLVGSLIILGDVSGDILNIDDLQGGVRLTGSLNATGRILIDGLCDGSITIDKQTVALSQIHITEGLDDGTITINYDGGDFDANGTIYIGEPTGPLGNVTFDGSILIQNGEGPHGCHGGDLNGDITVRGCHATSDDLDICICGSDNGRVTIIQTLCVPQVDWSCYDIWDCECQD